MRAPNIILAIVEWSLLFLVRSDNRIDQSPTTRGSVGWTADHGKGQRVATILDCTKFVPRK